MKRKLKKQFAVLSAGAVLMSNVVSMPISAVDNENIITNSTFDSGSTDWGIYKESGGKGTLSTDNGKLALTISDVGKVNYAVQMYYDIIPLYQNGVYRLSYEISSTQDRYVEAMIQQNGGTYQSYTWKGLDLTSEPQTIDYEFTMEAETDIMAKLVFNCGTQGEELPEHTIYLDNVVLELIDDSNVDYTSLRPYEPPIVTNQLGFKPSDVKTAILRFPSTTSSVTFADFEIINADTEEVAYTGSFNEEETVVYNAGDEVCGFINFTDLTEEGRYYIKCAGVEDVSYTFEISENPYGNLLDDSVRMLYLQRCGTEVEDEKFGHVECHNTDAVIYGSPNNVTIDVSGGWHDAGDYGRYVVPGAKAVADLLYAYAANPELYSDNVGIPESNNGIPDILDEVRYELEWMLKMQDESGGVYHKVTCENFPGYVMPEKEKGQLIVTPVSTTATADFCASMAMAYEFYYDIDIEFAETCLSAAKKAWAFLEENPNMIFENPEDITTGAYNDNIDTDERYWAATQMYRATGEESYIDGATTKTGLDWSAVGDYGNIAILTMDNIDKESEIYRMAKSSIIARADSFVNSTNSSPYGVAISKFNWGSNMTVANAGVLLGVAYQITGDETYITSAKSNLNYLLGNNPNGVSYVTGYGTVSPQNPHHRPSMAVGEAMIGMLVGGVNSNLEDSAAKAHLRSMPTAKRYVDHAESYSTNEITIYWNSPLTYLLSLTEIKQSENPDISDNTDITTIVWGDANCDGEVNVSDAVAVTAYVSNATKNSLSDQGIINADVQSTGNSLNANDALAIQQFSTGIITKLPVE